MIVENVIQIKSGITINVVVNAKDNIFGEDHILNAATCSYKDDKYLANIMDDSVITCDEIIDVEAKSYNEETKAIQKNFNEKK